MILGQSAGIAAALAAREEVTVQALDYAKLREQLLLRKQVLELPDLPPLPPRPASAVSVDPGKLSGIVLDDTTAELLPLLEERLCRRIKLLARAG